MKGNGSLGASREGLVRLGYRRQHPARPAVRQQRARAPVRRAHRRRRCMGDARRQPRHREGRLRRPARRSGVDLELPDLNSSAEKLGGQVQRARHGAGHVAKTRSQPERGSRRGSACPASRSTRSRSKAAGTLDAHEGDIKARNADLDLTAKLKGGWSGGALERRDPRAGEHGPAAARAAGAGAAGDRRRPRRARPLQRHARRRPRRARIAALGGRPPELGGRVCRAAGAIAAELPRREAAGRRPRAGRRLVAALDAEAERPPRRCAARAATCARRAAGGAARASRAPRSTRA